MRNFGDVWTRDMFVADDEYVGVQFGTASGFVSALHVWHAMQNRERVTVGEAAIAFNTTPEVIVEAVNEAYWLALYGVDDGPLVEATIESEGE